MAQSRKNELVRIEKVPLERRVAEVMCDQILSGAFPPVTAWSR